MRFPLYILGFGFILSVAAVTAQTAPQAQTPPVNPTTPANQVGDGAQSKAGTPVAPNATSPSTTGGIAGSASANTVQNQDAQTSGEQSPNTQETGGVSAMTDSDLQTQIQGALSKEPTLTGDSPHVSVSGDSIELAGAVNTNKEKITASRIVQSYAGSKKLVNNLTISGKPDTEKGTAPTASKPPQK
jgi:hypothetical protein